MSKKKKKYKVVVKEDLCDLMSRVLPGDKQFQGEWVLGLMPKGKVVRSRTTMPLEKALENLGRGLPDWWGHCQVMIAERDGIVIRDTLTGKPGGIVCREKVDELIKRAKTI